jgi:hypothetical protein
VKAFPHVKGLSDCSLRLPSDYSLLIFLTGAVKMEKKEEEGRTHHWASKNK